MYKKACKRLISYSFLLAMYALSIVAHDNEQVMHRKDYPLGSGIKYLYSSMPCKIRILPTVAGAPPSIILLCAAEDWRVLSKRLRIKKKGDTVHVSFSHGPNSRAWICGDPTGEESPYLEENIGEEDATRKVTQKVTKQPTLYLFIDKPLLGINLARNTEALVEGGAFSTEQAPPDIEIKLNHRAKLVFTERLKSNNLRIKLRKEASLLLSTLHTQNLTCELKNEASCTIDALSTGSACIFQKHISKLSIGSLEAKQQLRLKNVNESEALIETVLTPSLFIDCKQKAGIDIVNIFTDKLVGTLAQNATLVLHEGKIKVVDITEDKDAKSRLDLREIEVG